MPEKKPRNRTPKLYPRRATGLDPKLYQRFDEPGTSLTWYVARCDSASGLCFGVLSNGKEVVFADFLLSHLTGVVPVPNFRKCRLSQIPNQVRNV